MKLVEFLLRWFNNMQTLNCFSSWRPSRIDFLVIVFENM